MEYEMLSLNNSPEQHSVVYKSQKNDLYNMIWYCIILLLIIY